MLSPPCVAYSQLQVQMGQKRQNTMKKLVSKALEKQNNQTLHRSWEQRCYQLMSCSTHHDCPMQNTNWLRMSETKKKDLAKTGAALMDYACMVASIQIKLNRYFILEHPAGAASWQYPRVQSLCAMPGVEMSTFDQCMYGLTSKVHKIQMNLSYLGTPQPVLNS